MDAFEVEISQIHVAIGQYVHRKNGPGEEVVRWRAAELAGLVVRQQRTKERCRSDAQRGGC
jgi:hypothetical protein